MTAEPRRAIYINWSVEMERMLQTIANYIIGITPKDPIFPRPLRPTSQAAGKGNEYNVFEVCECCARVLAHDIQAGEDIDLKSLLNEVEGMKGGPILSVKGTVGSSFYDDLLAIHAALMAVGGMSNATQRGSVNIKTPLMVAILYAYAYVGGNEE